MKQNYPALILVLLLLFFFNVEAQQPQNVGEWTDPIPFNLVPAAVANLPDGRLLTWSSRYRASRFDAADGFTYTEIFDPNVGVNGQSMGLQITDNNHNMFCPGINNLADGRILVAGGGSAPRTTIYDPQTEIWTPSDNMNVARAYQGNVTLANGEVFTIGGQWDGGTTGKIGEIWTSQNGWKSLPGIPMNVLFNNNDLTGGHNRPADHAWVWGAPNGKVFHAGPSEDMHWLDVQGNGSVTFAGKRSDDVYSISGTTVMYDVGKILKVGGSIGYGNGTPASEKSYIIDINDENNVIVTKTANDIAFSRTHHNSVVLPNGEVLIVGGLSTARVFFDGGSRLNAEIWNPETNIWRTVAGMQVPRNYHSVSILMMDGRVFSGGGGLCNQCSVNHEDAEIYSPPYLFDSNGNLASRPEISAPETAQYNQTLQVQSSDDIASFSFIRMSSATHSVNNEQRRVPVSFSKNGNTYSLDVPGPTVMPPGYYMLFAIDQNGVPSMAEAVRMIPGIISVTAVEVNPTNIELSEGRNTTLVATITPSSATNQTINWSSANTNVATVDANGKVTAVGIGTTIITVTTDDGNFTAQTSVTVVESDGLCIASGTILMERYDGIEGVSLDGLFNSPNYPDNPSLTQELNNFEIPNNVADNYGAKVSGYLCAPETGIYYFWVSGDDESRLNISSDNDVSNITAIANVPGWTGPRQWDKYAEQKSVGIQLVQGLSYYIEAFMKEAGGGDNLAVGWRRPSDGDGSSPAEIIPGNVLSSESGPSFIPNPEVTYYIEAPIHNLRIAATGESEDSYTTAATTIGPDVEWQFIDRGNGFWHVQRANGGSLPRLRTDNSEFADMQETSSRGNYTYYDFTQGAIANTHFFTLPDGPAGRRRLQMTSDGLLRFVSTSLAGETESFRIIEVTRVTGVTVNTSSTTLDEGETIRLTATVDPADADDTRVTWSSSDETIATVNANGRVTAIAAGTATITVTANDGGFIDQSEIVVVSNAPPKPTQSSPIIVDSETRRAWVVNPDNNTVSILNADNLELIGEFPVAADPVSIAKDSQGNVWVTCRDAGVIQILNPQGTVLNSINLGRGSQPYGVVNDPLGEFLYVTLFASNKVLKINADSQTIVDELSIFTRPRALAITAEGSQLLVTQFITENNQGKIAKIDLADFELDSNVNIAADTFSSNTSTEAKGIANYLGGIAIHPESDKAWFTAKKDNIFTGAFQSGQDLNFATTIRALVSSFSISSGQESSSNRVDIDNHNLPTGITVSPLGNYVFVTMLTNNRIIVLDAANGLEVLRRDVGFAPSGIIIDPTNNRLFVKNFLSRSVHVFDANDLITQGTRSLPLLTEISTVSGELLNNQVLQGKQIFYNARDSRMTQQENSDAGYISCASCHIDGTYDGQTWDFTQRGEGLRNTISLRGRTGTDHGNVHWTGNFDEIHDFENDIRFAFGGTGFMTDQDFFSENRENPLGGLKEGNSAELDALKAYIESLNTFDESPNKNENGTMTTEALQGKTLFNNLQCTNCHGGEAFTNSSNGLLYNVGTVDVSSGQRLGRTLQGFDAPTLRDVWATPPYLHDGSAATLKDAVAQHAIAANLSQNDLELLEAYLLQLDGMEAAAPEGITFELKAPSTAPMGIPVLFSVSTTMSNIEEVIYYVDDVEVGRSSTSPYNFDFLPDSPNNYCVYAKAIHQGMATISKNQTVTITNNGGNTNNRVITLEGEDFTFSQDGEVGNYIPGFQGTGFLDLSANNSVGEWQFQSDEVVTASMTIVFNSGFLFERLGSLVVNGNDLGEIEFNSSANCFSWQSVRLNNIPFEEGLNTIRLTTVSIFGGVDIDFLEIELPSIPVTGVSVSPDTVTLTEGETQQLTATVSPADADNQSVTWSSGDESVATVDENGLVTAVSEGVVTITVTTNDGIFEAVSEITVISASIPVTGVIVSPDAVTLTEGDTQQLTATISPTDADDQLVTWSSADESIATIDANGLVTAVSEGIVTITVTTNDGDFSASSQITVVSSGSEPCVASGTILMQRYDGIPGVKISDLTGSSTYPDAPTLTSELTLFEIQENQGDDYGVRVSGYLCAPETGTYHFWIAGNNHVELNLSTTDNEADKTLVAYHSNWTGGRQWDKFSTQRSEAIELVQGQQYYIEALMKESRSGDNLAVGWRRPSNGDGDLPSEVIPGSVLSPFVTDFIAVNSVSLSPMNVEIPENGTTTLTATVLPSEASNKSVSWSSSDESIARVDSNGLVTAVSEGTATITVTTNDGGFTAESIVTVTASDPSSCEASGTILMQRYDGIPGARISDLIGASSYPEAPSLTSELPLFEIQENQGDDYGVRVSGYLCAPETGTYHFWVAGNNHTELYLSTTDNESDKIRIAYHSNWTGGRQWDKFLTQRSKDIELVQGQQYYIEALMKESRSGDNLAVGWRRPSNGQGDLPSEVIPGNVLSPNSITTANALIAQFSPILNVSVYPNPSKDILNILLSNNNDSEVENIQIYDMLGRNVLEMDGNNLTSDGGSYKVEVLGFNAGTYFLYIRMDDGTLMTKRFIKE